MPRILSIDGGGIRGLIPGIVLAAIEKSTQTPIARLFDVIAGTSTGGILACGLSAPLIVGVFSGLESCPSASLPCFSFPA